MKKKTIIYLEETQACLGDNTQGRSVEQKNVLQLYSSGKERSPTALEKF